MDKEEIKTVIIDAFKDVQLGSGVSLKQAEAIDSYCEAVNFEAEIIGPLENAVLEVVNRGDIDIFRLSILMTKGGNSIMRDFDYPIAKGDSISVNWVFLLDELDPSSTPEKIELFPVLVGQVKGQESTKPFTCLDNGKEIAF